VCLHLGLRAESWSSVRVSVEVIVKEGKEVRVEGPEPGRWFAGREDALGLNHVNFALSRSTPTRTANDHRWIESICYSFHPKPFWLPRICRYFADDGWKPVCDPRNVSVAEREPYLRIPVIFRHSFASFCSFPRPRVLHAARLELYSPPDSRSLNRGKNSGAATDVSASKPSQR
jgi:hypothetical protein